MRRGLSTIGVICAVVLYVLLGLEPVQAGLKAVSGVNFASPPVLGSVVPNAVNGTTGTWSGLQATTVSSGYAATFMGGNVGIGTVTPAGLFVINGQNATWSWNSLGGLSPGYLSGGLNVNNQILQNVNSISFNPAYASVGAIRMSNTNEIVWRNAANTADIQSIIIGTDDNLKLMPAGGNVGIGAAGFLLSGTAPTISSGFGTTPSVASNNGTATFRINVGTGGTASAGVIGLPAATNGWNCQVSEFNPNATALLSTTVVTASTTTTVTVQNDLLSTGAATAWQASQVLIANCMSY